MATYVGLVVEMIGKPRHARARGRIRISFSTENRFQHPDRLAKILLAKVGIKPLEILTDGRTAQVVLPLTAFGGDGFNPIKWNVEENLLTWLGSAKLALTEDELAEVYGEDKYVITAYRNHSKVYKATVTSVNSHTLTGTMMNGTQRTPIWSRRLYEHRELDQPDRVFWDMLQQSANSPDAFTKDLKPGDQIEVAEINYGWPFGLSESNCAQCWRFVSH